MGERVISQRTLWTLSADQFIPHANCRFVWNMVILFPVAYFWANAKMLPVCNEIWFLLLYLYLSVSVLSIFICFTAQPLTPHCHRRNARTADARMAVFQMGSHTHAISMTLYRDNRMKVVNELQRAHNFGADSKPVILLQGGDNISHYDTDVDYVFRQVRKY